MSGEKPKRPEDITDTDIKKVAIACAEKAGWMIEPDDCNVEVILPQTDVRPEIGLGWTTTRFHVTRWIVYMRPKFSLNKSLRMLAVPVEFAWNELSAGDLIELE